MTQQIERVPRTLPRALTPFRHPAYRRLAVALVLASFASGGMGGRAGVGGDPPRRRAGQLSIVATSAAVGVLLPALLGGVSPTGCRRSASSRASPRSSWPAWAWSRCSRSPTDAGVAPRRRRLRDRRRHGVLLPGLPRVAAGARARVRPAGGQRLRGHGAPDDRPGARPGGGRRRGRRGLAPAALGRRRRVAALACWRCAPCRSPPCAATPRAAEHRPPGAHRRRRHARGLRLHGAHAVAAGHAAVRLADDPGDDGPARGADAVPDQGQARWRSRRPRHRAGGLRHRRRRGLDGGGLAADAAALPDLDEPDVGRRLPAVRRHGRGHARSGWSSRPPSCSARCSPRRWSSGARCSSAGCRRTCWAGSPRSTSSSRSA